MPELLKASRASVASQSSWEAACSWKPRASYYWGFPGISLYFHYFPSFFCTLRFSALCSNTALPLCWLPSAGNSSECPPPGNAPDDTVCVDMGKCKDGECVPFCERERNLRSCACNGGWHTGNWNGAETEICISSLLLRECWLHCGLSLWFLEKCKLLGFSAVLCLKSEWECPLSSGGWIEDIRMRLTLCHSKWRRGHFPIFQLYHRWTRRDCKEIPANLWIRHLTEEWWPPARG